MNVYVYDYLVRRAQILDRIFRDCLLMVMLTVMTTSFDYVHVYVSLWMSVQLSRALRSRSVTVALLRCLFSLSALLLFALLSDGIPDVRVLSISS